MMTKAEFERLMTAVSNGYAAADKNIDCGNREEFLRHGKWALGVLKRCFHDTDHKSAYKQIVANLIEIIGKDKLVNFIYGEQPKIRLIKQQEHKKDSTVGLEITRDIRKIYRLYELSKDEITTLIEKIPKRWG